METSGHMLGDYLPTGEPPDEVMCYEDRGDGGGEDYGYLELDGPASDEFENDIDLDIRDSLSLTEDLQQALQRFTGIIGDLADTDDTAGLAKPARKMVEETGGRVEQLRQEDRLDEKLAWLGDKEAAQQRAERKLRRKQAEKQGRLKAVRRDLDRTRSEHGDALDDMARDEGQLHGLDRALYEKAGQLAGCRGDAERAAADVGFSRKLLRVEQLRLDRVHKDCEQLGYDVGAFQNVTRKYEESQMDLRQARRDHEDAQRKIWELQAEIAQLRGELDNARSESMVLQKQQASRRVQVEVTPGHAAPEQAGNGRWYTPETYDTLVMNTATPVMEHHGPEHDKVVNRGTPDV
ncbi:chromosome segregation protein [Microdochium nivale]|nr:chromosome segregation protein [Microdochium nivale]